MVNSSKLAIYGGEKAVTLDDTEALRWPIITDEEIAAVTDLLRKGELSISQVTYKFEEEFAKYHNVKYALAHNNGTAAIHAAFFAVGVGPGDEVITPSYTYWGTAMPILSCNAVPVFCEVDPNILCADPRDIRKRITPQTKAIIVVHLWGMPAEIDEIMAIAKEHDIAVIEDASHAHGAVYKGKKVGTIGDIGCFSLQTSKLMIGGEGGILITNDTEYYERAVSLAHYERISKLPTERYRRYAHTGFGWKYRINPLAAAIARVQLKYLDERNKKREDNIEYLSSGLRKVRGIHPFETPPYVSRTHYGHRVRYSQEELDGVPRERFAEALQAEGVKVRGERYPLLHLQPIFQERNLYGKGCPFDCSHTKRKVVYKQGDLPVTERSQQNLLALPTFPQAQKGLLDQYITAFEKVTENVDQLINS